jgi:hypothetical protein
MIKWNCVFIIWTLDFENETSYLVVKKQAFQMGSITFGYRNGCTEKNGYVGYSKWIIKMQYHDLCLD